MNVAEQIAVFKATISKLETMDPGMEVEGHVAYPEGGYSGDLDEAIKMISVETDDETVVLGLHY